MFKFQNLVGMTAVAVASIALAIAPAHAQVISASSGAANGSVSDSGVTVFYIPDGVGTATTAVVADDVHAAHVGWGAANTLVGASWINKETDIYNGSFDPKPQYGKEGNWEYDQTFFVTLDEGVSQAALFGKMLSDDNIVSITLNGVDVTSGYTQGGVPTWQVPSTFDTRGFGGVTNGENRLSIVLSNSGSFVSGVAYNFSVVPVVPEPGILVFGLMSSGSLAGLMLRGRVRFNRNR